MNKMRKAKLTQRAYAFARPRGEVLRDISNIATGYEAGYRAAMSDARKELAHADETREPNLPEAVRRTRLLGAIRNFLLPLR